MSVAGAEGSDGLMEVAIGDDSPASMPGSWSGEAVLFEPGEHLGPAVLGRFGPVTRPVIGVEAVRGIWIDLDLAGFSGRLARRRHLLDALDGDTLVGSAVKAEHRRLQLGGHVGREFRLHFPPRRVERPVPVV